MRYQYVNHVGYMSLNSKPWEADKSINDRLKKNSPKV